jgi:[ribosomal protein S18]-alanine N-acetyltransferase
MTDSAPTSPRAPSSASALPIRAIATDAEARACAEIMATNEPWVTIGRTLEESYRILRDPVREVYVAVEADDRGEPRVVGFIVLVMQGAFVGYIQSVAVRDDRRGLGVGSALIAFAERRIFRDQPNVFICASSFNPGARRLYERLGYRAVGELTDFMVRGHSELLLRKTIGPLAEHVARSDDGESPRPS